MGFLLSKSKTPEIDGIRGMALIFVILSHMSNPYNFIFSGSGKQGVWLFFILSSFLLSSYFLSSPERTTSVLEWVNYIVRRVLRIYPLYIFVLLFYLFFYQSGEITSKNIFNHILLTDGIGHFWTMPVEIHFYFLLPVVILIVIHLLKQNVVWTGFVLLVCLALHQIIAPPALSRLEDFHLLTYLPVFLIGCFLATIYTRTKEIKFTSYHKFLFDSISVLILAVMFITMPKVWSVVFYQVPLDYFHRSFIWYGLGWAAFVWFTISGTIVKKVFALPYIRIWGVISYGAYLIHLMVLEIVTGYMEMGVFAAILIFTIVFGISILLHILIERPFIKVNLLKLRKEKAENKVSSVVFSGKSD